LENIQYKILLVDDDDLNHRMMGLLLSGGGYTYESAYNGVEAIEAIKSKQFDLVLMDLQMPIMDGYEATRKIRAWEANGSRIPIIALSAMIVDDEIELCLETGMDGCIIKPFNTDELFQIIDSHVQKKALPIGFQGGWHQDMDTFLNIKATLPRFGNDIQIYREFLLDFLQSLPEKLEEFRSTLVSGNFQALSKKAHNLKGVAASMGAMQLSASAAKLERMSRDNEVMHLEEIIEDCAKNAQSLQDNAMRILSKTPE
jgi:CheY-like chemotaxis protein/HPt (histidine-containing phosphotransfer) domain-containing protein